MDIIVNKGTVKGEVIAPPSKSYAHRIILASYLCGKKVNVYNAGTSQDVLATVGAIKALGATVTYNGNCLTILKGELPKGKIEIDCNASGSTLRFLMPILSALNVNATLNGTKTLMSRPVEKLVDCLKKGGANIDGFNINGGLKSGTYYIDASISSQYVTGLLFALSILEGESKIILTSNIVSLGYINITIDVLKQFGVDVDFCGNVLTIKGNSYNNVLDGYVVEGDWSGASFMLALGATNGEVKVKNLNLNSRQGDIKILDVLRDFGANIKIDGDAVTVLKSSLKGITVDVQNIPDLAQVIASVASFADGKTTILNVERLRIKESDRVNAIINSLNALKIKAKLVENSIEIYGGSKSSGTISGDDDHRTVMSAVVASTNVDNGVTILGAEAIEKSYPNFLQDFKAIGGSYVVKI